MNFLKGQLFPEADPTSAVVWVNRPGDDPVFGPESGWDVLFGLKKEGKTVFLPYARSEDDGSFI